MVLIPADAFAVYRQGSNGRATRLPVICWSEREGALTGLVLSGGRPVPAEEVAGFEGYEPSRCGRAVATLPPTPGCTVRGENGAEMPLVGWIVYESGDIHPAVLNREEGIAMDAEQVSERGPYHEYVTSRIRWSGSGRDPDDD
jgi:hypothetical protein